MLPPRSEQRVQRLLRVSRSRFEDHCEKVRDGAGRGQDPLVD